MILSTSQIQRFYDIFIPLLVYTNGITKTLPEDILVSLGDIHNPQAESELRAGLWTNSWIIDEFIEENIFDFKSEDLEVVKSWKTFRYGDFTLGKVINGRGIFMAFDDLGEIFSVCPLFSSFEEILPKIPIMVRTAIIPFENVLVYDGSISSYPVSFGPGLRGMINKWYINAKELHNIRSSFLPPSPLSEKEKQIQVEETNKSVLRYFKKYSRAKGRSDKITNRDYETARIFSVFLLNESGGIKSLREITKENFIDYITVSKDFDNPAKIGLRRFFEYMADTERLDWDLSRELLGIIEDL